MFSKLIHTIGYVFKCDSLPLQKYVKVLIPGTCEGDQHYLEIGSWPM